MLIRSSNTLWNSGAFGCCILTTQNIWKSTTVSFNRIISSLLDTRGGQKARGLLSAHHTRAGTGFRGNLLKFELWSEFSCYFIAWLLSPIQHPLIKSMGPWYPPALLLGEVGKDWNVLVFCCLLWNSENPNDYKFWISPQPRLILAKIKALLLLQWLSL